MLESVLTPQATPDVVAPPAAVPVAAAPVAAAPVAYRSVVWASVTAPLGADGTTHAPAGDAHRLSSHATTGDVHRTTSGDTRQARAEARGHSAGYAAGLRAAELELAAHRAALEAEHATLLDRLHAATVDAVTALAASSRALDARVAPVLVDAEEALVATAFDLAEAVLGYELRASEPADDTASAPHDDPRAGRTARAAVARALAVVDPATVTTVRLHPADLAQLGRADLGAVAADLAFVADASLARGDAEAVLPTGLVDARLGTALDRARTALTGGGAL